MVSAHFTRSKFVTSVFISRLCRGDGSWAQTSYIIPINHHVLREKQTVRIDGNAAASVVISTGGRRNDLFGVELSLSVRHTVLMCFVS